jgi:hypothetical protein
MRYDMPAQNLRTGPTRFPGAAGGHSADLKRPYET